MKKMFYSLSILALVFVFGACSNDDNDDAATSTPANIEARAVALGFTDTKSYQASVAEQCVLGNHENCDILADGTHLACGYADHSGKNHDGTNHKGMDHGTHDANGNHIHNNGSEGHNGGNSNNGGHH